MPPSVQSCWIHAAVTKTTFGHTCLRRITSTSIRCADRSWLPVQYLPDDLTKALLVRAGVDKNRVHLVYATGAQLPNDEILSSSMVCYVLEKFGVKNIHIVDGGLAEWQKQKFPVTQEYFGNPAGQLPSTMQPEIGIAIDELLKVKQQPNVIVVDARPHNEYVGEDDVWLRKGHIPVCDQFSLARLMEKDNTHKFLPAEQASAELARLE